MAPSAPSAPRLLRPSRAQASWLHCPNKRFSVSFGRTASPSSGRQKAAAGRELLHNGLPPGLCFLQARARRSCPAAGDRSALATLLEITSLPSSGKEAAAARGKGAGKRGLKSSKPPPAKKAAAKAQSNGQAQETSAVQLPESLAPSFKALFGNKEQDTEQGAQESAQANPVAKAKTSKNGKKEKPSKKRKLADGDNDSKVSKSKKLKMQSREEAPLKKKKKKSKSSDRIKSTKKKDSKEKKSDKKKKKSKNVERLGADGSQKKKKKKKKKMDNLPEEA